MCLTDLKSKCWKAGYFSSHGGFLGDRGHEVRFSDPLNSDAGERGGMQLTKQSDWWESKVWVQRGQLNMIWTVRRKGGGKSSVVNTISNLFFCFFFQWKRCWLIIFSRYPERWTNGKDYNWKRGSTSSTGADKRLGKPQTNSFWQRTDTLHAIWWLTESPGGSESWECPARISVWNHVTELGQGRCYRSHHRAQKTHLPNTGMRDIVRENHCPHPPHSSNHQPPNQRYGCSWLAGSRSHAHA